MDKCHPEFSPTLAMPSTYAIRCHCVNKTSTAKSVLEESLTLLSLPKVLACLNKPNPSHLLNVQRKFNSLNLSKPNIYSTAQSLTSGYISHHSCYIHFMIYIVYHINLSCSKLHEPVADTGSHITYSITPCFLYEKSHHTLTKSENIISHNTLSKKRLHNTIISPPHEKCIAQSISITFFSFLLQRLYWSLCSII